MWLPGRHARDLARPRLRARAYLRVASWLADARGRRGDRRRLRRLPRSCEKLILDLAAIRAATSSWARPHADALSPREETRLGSIRYSTGGGGLSAADSADCRARPDREALARPPGRPDRRADVLLERGLPARPPGPGRTSPSSAARAAAAAATARASHSSTGMAPGTVSTALTYDRTGHCIEGAGIPVDVLAEGSDADVLAFAETL